jgi:molybdopterin-guanine dinucleotide biosynthesis protein A
MGASKATMAWHGSTLVRRVAGIVARGVDGPVVLVRSPAQRLPALPASFEVLDDLEEGKGPLGGLAVGLRSLADRCEAVFVSSTDMPFLHPAFVRKVMGELTADACVPCVRGFRQSLAAGYRTSLVPVVDRLLGSGRLRVALVLEECAWHELDEEALFADACLARFDPELASVTNLNNREEYETAKRCLEPAVRVERCEAGAASPQPTTVRASTLGGAAAAVSLSLTADAFVTLNGAETSPDPEEPLAEGDVVSFTTAVTEP